MCVCGSTARDIRRSHEGQQEGRSVIGASNAWSNDDRPLTAPESSDGMVRVFRYEIIPEIDKERFKFLPYQGPSKTFPLSERFPMGCRDPVVTGTA